MAKTPVTTPNAGVVDEYIAELPDEQKRADAKALCQMMADVTGEPAAMWGTSIIGFGSYHYCYASGNEGDAPLASFSPRKQHLVIYLVGGFEDRHTRDFAKLGPHKTGKGCLYLKRLSDVDFKVLRRLVDRSVPIRRGVDEEGDS